jgi:predicted secreted protein
MSKLIKKSHFLSFVLLIPFLLFLGCSESLNKSDSNVIVKNFSVTANESFSFELEVCATCGYQLDYSISDTSIVAIDSISFRPKDEDLELIGGNTIQTFYLTSKTNGNCIIDIIEHRVWESDIEPINTFKCYINVN